MQSTEDLTVALLQHFAAVADRLDAMLVRVSWETYIESEQRTVGQLVDHLAWAWEAESAAFRAIASGSTGSGWTQQWLDAQNAEQARLSANRTRRETMQRYRASRDLAIAFIKSLNATGLGRTGLHMPGEPERTVAGWIEVCLIGHPLEHLPQIETALIDDPRW